MRLRNVLIFAGLLGCSNPVSEIPITVDYSKYSFQNNEKHGVFLGEVYNYGDRHLVGLYPVVHYENNGVAVSDTGKIYLDYDSRNGVHFEISSLRAGTGGYWQTTSKEPLLLDAPPEYRVEFGLR